MYEIKDEPLSGVDCGAGAFMNAGGAELLSLNRKRALLVRGEVGERRKLQI